MGGHQQHSHLALQCIKGFTDRFQLETLDVHVHEVHGMHICQHGFDRVSVNLLGLNCNAAIILAAAPSIGDTPQSSTLCEPN